MNALDSVLDAVLLATIVLQFRGRRLTPRNLALPVVIVVTFLLTDLRGVPTAGNVGYLVPEGVLLGLVFGVGAGDVTRVSARGGGTDAQAGLLAAAFWTVGVVGRAAFSSYATDGESGADRTIGHLCTQLTSPPPGRSWPVCCSWSSSRSAPGSASPRPATWRFGVGA